MRTLQGFSTALWASLLDPAAQMLLAAVSACERRLVLQGPGKMNLGWAAMWALLSGLVGPGDGLSMLCPLKWWRLGCVEGDCSLQEGPPVGWTACCPPEQPCQEPFQSVARGTDKEESRTSLYCPWAAPSQRRCWADKSALPAFSPKPLCRPKRLFMMLKCHWGVLQKHATTEGWSKAAGSVLTLPSLPPQLSLVSPSAAGGQQYPCHLCFWVYGLVSFKGASSDQSKMFPPTRPLPALEQNAQLQKAENKEWSTVSGKAQHLGWI